MGDMITALRQFLIDWLIAEANNGSYDHSID